MRYDHCEFARRDADGEYHCIQPCCWHGGCEAPPRMGSDGRELPPAAIKTVPREMPPEMLRAPEPADEEPPKKDIVKRRHQRLIAEIKKLVAEGVKGQENLAKHLGVSAQTIYNLERLYPGQIVYERHTHQYNWTVLGPKIDEMLAKGATKKEVRAFFNLPKRTLANYCSGRRKNG